MTITIFGASGNVGRLVVNEALRRNHKVVAFVHKSSLPKRKGLSLKKGDIHDVESVGAAIKGSDAVISTLGSWGTSGKDILSVGMQNIIPAMTANNVRRLVSLTGSDARADGDDLSLAHHFSRALFKIIASKVMADAEQHIQMLEDSGLDWCIVRSPRISRQGTLYKLEHERSMPWASVGRSSVATCLVDLAENSEYTKQAPYIHRA